MGADPFYPPLAPCFLGAAYYLRQQYQRALPPLRASGGAFVLTRTEQTCFVLRAAHTADSSVEGWGIQCCVSLSCVFAACESFCLHACTLLALASASIVIASSSGSAQIMTTPGQAGVSPTGAATYKIPITAPPGTAGMMPAISLSYSSHQGNGLLGIGWAIEGLPSVGRCPRTVAQGSVRGAVNYDSNDRFCLDGLGLIGLPSTSLAPTVSPIRTPSSSCSLSASRMPGDGETVERAPEHTYLFMAQHPFTRQAQIALLEALRRIVLSPACSRSPIVDRADQTKDMIGRLERTTARHPLDHTRDIDPSHALGL